MCFGCKLNLNFGEQKMDYSQIPCPTTQFVVAHNGNCNWLTEGQRKIPQGDFLVMDLWYPTSYVFFGNINTIPYPFPNRKHYSQPKIYNLD